jgi:hypothetical protein
MSTGSTGRGRRLAALTALLAIAGCAAPQPLTLSNSFTPSTRVNSPFPKSTAAVCTLRIADVKDVRPDSHAMGGLSARQVYHDNSAAWIRSGLDWLKRDGRLKFAEGSDPGDLVVSVELIKAYIDAITGTEKSVTIVLRVKYSRGDVNLGEEVARGHVDTMNWAYGDGEIQSSFDSALEDALIGADRSILAHCKA